ncbi:MAG: hypothetical protein HOB82_06990 [Alphaproteobacteria bacterium]|jgi:hypothetical protein|nr:hypothetical protein [Alphaproteobacteria bacterium]MBT4711257.1 hypothetical protein [Alphaproteobacteria bacterium]MBT5859944.1 hypothetical protein [Alphaproteobacteria bacterium]
MTKFIMVYKGPATPMDEMTEEQGKAVMDAWGAWMGKVGDGLVDVGSPFGPGNSIRDDGTTGSAAELSGYSIIEAADLASATEMTGGHPFFSEGKGNFSIEVFELMPVPF